ncbi:DUF7373 family lipoprotein [Gordonia shandongensis]|uniref:DUF7373 family lipoprotein n=1 Tax=Gordonia shandongensis TaxID=376351 RepID=UPI0012EBAA7C|nr:hypothetical protein [Gordonia shandongensis]
MQKSWRRPLLPVFALVLGMALAACAVDGTPTRGPITLKTGKYGGEQTPALGDADSPVSWAKLRAVRLADHMVFPSAIDPKLDDGKLPTQPLATVTNTQIVIPDTADLPAMKHFEYGFTVTAGNADDNDYGFNQAVYVFSDDKAATAAVDELSGAMLKPSRYSKFAKAPVPGLPAGAVGIHDGGKYGETVAAFTTQGSRLIYTWAKSPDRGWSERVAATGQEQQIALLKDVGADSDDRRIDPDGLLTGTLRSDDGNPLHKAVYGRRAAALFYGDQEAALRALTAAGIDRFAWNGSQAYRAASERQAAGWVDFLAENFEDETTRKASSPQDLGSARCLKSGRRAACFITVGRYVGEVYDSTLEDAQAQISAQYTFLKKLRD